MAKWVRSVTINRAKIYDAASSFDEIGKPFYKRNKQLLALKEFSEDLKKRVKKSRTFLFFVNTYQYWQRRRRFRSMSPEQKKLRAQ
jgi:hypothetical protein